MTALRETRLANLQLFRRGKVRDVYDLGEHLLIVATDRISAFDVIMNEPVPDKGRILTQISAFWFSRTSPVIPNHVVSTDVVDFPHVTESEKAFLEGRSMLVRKSKALPVECIVRGYLSGSAWKEYQLDGSICGIALPQGLRESDRLPEPIFTPSTKAESGHDQNITFEDVEKLVGGDVATQVRDRALEVYRLACRHAESRGIIIADTKMEFGLLDNRLILIDELLTPDSSRFWPMDAYAPGRSQPSFDKQFLRDYLLSIKWDPNTPAPSLPQHIIEKTRDKYLEALRSLTG